MRKFIAAMMVAGAALIAGTATAADFPDYPPIIEIPDVDYGVQGSFYLRGSVGANAYWADRQRYFCPSGLGCPAGGSGGIVTETPTEWGGGYSFGAGFGYETGYGPRFDLTLDHLRNEGLANVRGQQLNLRSTILLANAYYDFGFSDYGSASGGFGAYAGAGIGGAYNWLESRGPWTGRDPDGGTYTPAAALMAGVTYDMGAIVADLGYRMVYIPQLSNGDVGLTVAQGPYYIDNNFIHEVRGTLRYRFN